MPNLEIEKRFLITELSQNFPFSSCSVNKLEQGYIELASKNKNFRVRITDDHDALLTIKSGRGMIRGEKEYPKLPGENLPIDLATFLLKNICEHRIKKDRHLKDGWAIDFFKNPFEGIVIAEIEFKSVKDVPKNIKLPDWIGVGIDITDSLTSHRLAQIADQIKGANGPATLSNLIKWIKNSTK